MTENKTLNCYINKPYIVGGIFAPIEVVVYKIPSIDECIALLPRDVGNHILSYTNARIEWYLENIRKKYGDKFIIEMLQIMFISHFTNYNTISKICKTKYKNKQNADRILNYTIININKILYKQKFTRNYIRIAFEEHLSLHLTTIALKEENKLKKKQEYDIWFSILQVGDILIDKYLIISKTNKSYRCIKIILSNFSHLPYNIIRPFNFELDTHISRRTEYNLSPRKPIKVRDGITNNLIDLDYENILNQLRQIYLT